MVTREAEVTTVAAVMTVVVAPMKKMNLRTDAPNGAPPEGDAQNRSTPLSHSDRSGE